MNRELPQIHRMTPISGTVSYSPRTQLAPSTGQIVATAGAGAGTLASVLGSPVIGSLIAGGTALLGQYLQNRASLDAEKRSRAYALQDRLHEELYNSPAMQKLRLKQAGLSPAEFIQQFETGTQSTQVAQPDFSMLGESGQLFLNGFQSAIQARSEQAKARADIRLLEAEADSKREEARTARERYDLEIANKRLENSRLGQDLQLVRYLLTGAQLDNEGKRIANDSALLNYFFNRDTRETRKESLETANRIAKLDESQKAFALEFAEATRELNLELLSGRVEGMKLDNDLKSVTIKGKTYEVENILPAELQNLLDRHELNEGQRNLLTYAVFHANRQAKLEKMQVDIATHEYEAIKKDWNKYVGLIQKRLDIDYKSADTLASAVIGRSLFGLRSGYMPIVDTVLNF